MQTISIQTDWESVGQVTSQLRWPLRKVPLYISGSICCFMALCILDLPNFMVKPYKNFSKPPY